MLRFLSSSVFQFFGCSPIQPIQPINRSTEAPKHRSTEAPSLSAPTGQNEIARGKRYAQPRVFCSGRGSLKGDNEAGATVSRSSRPVPHLQRGGCPFALSIPGFHPGLSHLAPSGRNSGREPRGDAPGSLHRTTSAEAAEGSPNRRNAQTYSQVVNTGFPRSHARNPTAARSCSQPERRGYIPVALHWQVTT